MAVVAADDPPSVTELRAFQAGGRAWVCTDTDDVPVAYLLVDVIDDEAHIEQVSVHPDHARQRLGERLIDHIETWAQGRGLASLTLTTYRDVPWNAPYYARLGFNELEEPTIGPGLREVRRKEADRGLDRWLRVAMRRYIRRRQGEEPEQLLVADLREPRRRSQSSSVILSASPAPPPVAVKAVRTVRTGLGTR